MWYQNNFSYQGLLVVLCCSYSKYTLNWSTVIGNLLENVAQSGTILIVLTVLTVLTELTVLTALTVFTALTVLAAFTVLAV